MTLKHLQIFVVVFQEESITRAARQLSMTQPAVSLAVKELEHYYGTKLFERYGRSIRSTEAGKQLYEYASRLVGLYDEMDYEIKNWNRTGKLRIGSSISIGACLMPEYMRKFSKRYPDADALVRIDSSDVIEKMVLENKLDLALIEGNVHSEKIIKKKFLDDELLPVCGRFHMFAERSGPVSLEEMKKQKFLLREPNSGTRELVESVFAMNGFQVHPIWESTSTAAILNAVIAEIGISILPKRMMERQLRNRHVIPFSIEGIDFKRQYSMIYHENKYITPLMKDFFEIVEEVSARI